MRVHSPELAVDGRHAVVGARLERDDGSSEWIHIGVPVDLVGAVDLSGTPWVPVAAAVAAVIGEDVHLDAPVDPATLGGARRNAATMSGWWADDGWRTPRITAPTGAPVPSAGARGHGLFFS